MPMFRCSKKSPAETLVLGVKRLKPTVNEDWPCSICLNASYTIVSDRSLRSYNDRNDGAWAWPGLGAVWGYVGTHIGAVRTHDQPRMCGPDDCIRRCTSSCEHGFPNGTAGTSRTVSAARMPFTCPAASQSPPLQELTGTLRKAKKYKDRYRILYRRHNLGLDPDEPPAGA